MINSWSLYLITRLDNINELLCILCFVLFITIFILGFYTFHRWMECELDEDNNPNIIKSFKIVLICFFIILGIQAMVPSTKEMAFIILTPKVLNNEQVQKLPDNALKFLNKKLESYINDLDGVK